MIRRSAIRWRCRLRVLRACNSLSGVILQSILVWINRAGLDSATFNPISTPFIANGTGFDGVLHNSTINLSTGKLNLSDGSTTQTSTITYTIGAALIAINSITSGSKGTSVSLLSTAVPVNPALQAAVAGMTDTMDNFAATVNSRQGALASADMLPLLANDAVNDGWSRSDYAGILAGGFRPPGTATVTLAFTLLRIKSLDIGSGRGEAIFSRSLTLNGLQGRPAEQDMFFENAGGAWLLEGDHQIGGVSLSSGAVFGENPVQEMIFSASADAPQGTVSSVSVSGGGIWNNAALGKNIGVPLGAFTTGPVLFPVDDFLIPTPVTLSSPLPAGAPFTFSFVPATGPPVSYVLPSPAATTETIAITAPATRSLSGIALGQPLQVNWTQPTTFAVASAAVSVVVSNSSGPGGNLCPADVGVANPGTTTSASVTIPSACLGTVAALTISVNLAGPNGESASSSILLQ